MNSRWLAIVNPQAGGIRHRYLGRDFLDELASKVTTTAYTSGPNDATLIAAQAGEYDGLVAVGGDGTVADVLTGMNSGSQRFAVVPAGTGNCLAVDLGLRTARAGLRAIAHGRPKHIDMMQAVLRHVSGSTIMRNVASTAGMGYAADVAVLAKRRFSRLRGHAYAAAAVFVRPQHREIQMSSDGQETCELQLTGLLINNTRHIGTVRPFPQARIDDGVLDFFAFNVGWVRQCLHDLEMATGFPVYGTPRSRKAKTLRLRFGAPETAMLDGELFEHVTEMELICRPNALTCMSLDRCHP